MTGAGVVWGQRSTVPLGQLGGLDPAPQDSISTRSMAHLLEDFVLDLDRIQRMSFSISLPSTT